MSGFIGNVQFQTFKYRKYDEMYITVKGHLLKENKKLSFNNRLWYIALHQKTGQETNLLKAYEIGILMTRHLNNKPALTVSEL